MKSRIANVLLVVGFCFTFGCDPKPPKSPPLSQPDHVAGTLQPPTSAPATSEEWVRLVRQLDDARAENQRKDKIIEERLSSIKTANEAVWKQIGAYSWMLVVPGLAIFIGSLLPWTAFLAPFRTLGITLLGLGISISLIPHIIATYGPIAFYPAAVVAGLWVCCVAGLHVWSLYRRLSKIETLAKSSDSPVVKAKHLGAAAAIERVINPRVDQAFKLDRLRITP